MPIVVIPTTNKPFYSQVTRLDGRDYVLTLLFNQREDCWYLSIADDESAPLLSGLKLQANWPLLWRHRYNTKLPPGEIMAVTTTDTAPPTLNDFGEGKRCTLTYFDKAWIDAFKTPVTFRQVTIYVAVRVTPLGGYPGDTSYAAALATACAGLGAPGSTLSTSDVFAAASTVAGATVTALAIGTSPIEPIPVTVIANTISIGASPAGFAVTVVSS